MIDVHCCGMSQILWKSDIINNITIIIHFLRITMTESNEIILMFIVSTLTTLGTIILLVPGSPNASIPTNKYLRFKVTS